MISSGGPNEAKAQLTGVIARHCVEDIESHLEPIGWRCDDLYRWVSDRGVLNDCIRILAGADPDRSGLSVLSRRRLRTRAARIRSRLQEAQRCQQCLTTSSADLIRRQGTPVRRRPGHAAGHAPALPPPWGEVAMSRAPPAEVQRASAACGGPALGDYALRRVAPKRAPDRR